MHADGPRTFQVDEDSVVVLFVFFVFRIEFEVGSEKLGNTTRLSRRASLVRVFFISRTWSFSGFPPRFGKANKRFVAHRATPVKKNRFQMEENQNWFVVLDCF